MMIVQLAKGSFPHVDVVEEIDREEGEHDHDHDDLIVDSSPSPSINQSQSRGKENRGANLIANSITELGNGFTKWLELSSRRLAEALRRMCLMTLGTL
ncbi:hypothetical protein RJT34_17393 [Clitoria ternatea]|uniref:Uncharacterized protein n=1 Tax=Clitoria ternatea TaxID=43366 RepID=A0AAN9JC04_CLITE